MGGARRQETLAQQGFPHDRHKTPPSEGFGGGFAGEVTSAVSDFGSQGAQAVGGFAGDTVGAVGGFGQEGGAAVGGFGQEGAGTLGEMLGDVNPDLADATATANNQLGTMELRQKLVISS